MNEFVYALAACAVCGVAFASRREIVETTRQPNAMSQITLANNGANFGWVIVADNDTS